MCSAALAADGRVLAVAESAEGRMHSEMLTVFAEKVLQQAGFSFNDLDAVAVSKGPGSYTGLRIGVSAAKGFCYALGIPLISVGTLHALASGVLSKQVHVKPDVLFCPMIDARRMEVYCAFYDHKGKEVSPPSAEIISGDSFEKHLREHRVFFFGDGSPKCKAAFSGNANAVFIDNIAASASWMASIAEQKFRKGEKEILAHFEPFYLKNFLPGKTAAERAIQ